MWAQAVTKRRSIQSFSKSISFMHRQYWCRNWQPCSWRARDEEILEMKITRNRHQLSWIYSETIQKLLFLINESKLISGLDVYGKIKIHVWERSIRKQLTTLCQNDNSWTLIVICLWILLFPNYHAFFYLTQNQIRQNSFGLQIRKTYIIFSLKNKTFFSSANKYRNKCLRLK